MISSQGGTLVTQLQQFIFFMLSKFEIALVFPLCDWAKLIL
jgi:hypothetical protein